MFPPVNVEIGGETIAVSMLAAPPRQAAHIG
jgi:hypothetical protein